MWCFMLDASFYLNKTPCFKHTLAENLAAAIIIKQDRCEVARLRHILSIGY
jgi:hypothetical protein